MTTAVDAVGFWASRTVTRPRSLGLPIPTLANRVSGEECSDLESLCRVARSSRLRSWDPIHPRAFSGLT